MKIESLIKPRDVDRILGYRPGQAERQAKRNKLTHVVLPNGDIRFRKADVEKIISSGIRLKKE